MQKETFKNIPGCNGYYQISKSGVVKVLPHSRQKTIKERILKISVTPTGHFQCGVLINGNHKTISVQILMAITYMDYTPKKGFVVDHIDFDPSNNRLDNLQIITHRENLSKDRFRKNPTSRYTGVCWHKRQNKWISNIVINNKLIHLGYFENEIDASNTYQKKLEQLNKR